MALIGRFLFSKADPLYLEMLLSPLLLCGIMESNFDSDQGFPPVQGAHPCVGHVWSLCGSCGAGTIVVATHPGLLGSLIKGVTTD